MRTALHSIIDWVSDGCPYQRPFEWLDGKLVSFFAGIKRRWMKWLANELIPYLPEPPTPPHIVTAEIVDKRWRKPKPAKCVNTTQCSSGTVVSIPIRELHRTTAMQHDDTTVETRKLRMTVKPVEKVATKVVSHSKLDEHTANLPNQDLADMLKALGCKGVSKLPENTYRARLL
jgi:hypothetical protein